MLVSDFITNSLYKGTNQTLPSYLLGQNAVVNAINFALNDIYTFEGKYRTFMYDSKNVDLSAVSSTVVTHEVTLDHPIMRVMIIQDLSTNNIQTYSNINIEPFDGVKNLANNEFYYKPGTKKIKLYNNKVGYIIHYIHYFDFVTYSSTIPIPDVFLGALYNGTLGYIYPTYGQRGENKEVNVFNKMKEQLTNLAKFDSMQMAGIDGGNIR